MTNVEPQEDPQSFVVAVGGLNDVTLFGPFDTFKEAEEFAKEEVEETYSIHEVLSPDVYEASE